MASRSKPPAIVAELGRPETPSETAARKARDSHNYRARKTVNNLVFSLLVTLALVVVIVLVVPRGTDTWSDHSVDVAQSAADASPTAGQPLVAPEVPETWLAKQAALRSAPSGDITYWYIGYTTADEKYAAVVQAFTGNGVPPDETWVAQQLEGQTATGTERIGGIEWTIYDHASRDPDQANMLFGARADIGATTVLVYGTDTPDVLRQLIESVAAALDTAALDAAAQPASSASEDADPENGAAP